MPNWEESYVTEVTGYTTSGDDEVAEESVEIPTRLTDYVNTSAAAASVPKNTVYTADEDGGMEVPMDDDMMNEAVVKPSGSKYGTDAQSVGYTAYTMNMTSGEQIIEELRNVGVNVLSVEGDADVFAYLDAVTAERLPGEQCLLYTDDMGRVFNIVISGGTRGLASTWEALQGTFSGWLVCVAFPVLARILASSSSLQTSGDEGDDSDADKPNVGVHPGLLLAMFGLFFYNETSMSWISTAINVRGTNSIGAYVWNSSVLSDYPRYFMLLCLGLASFAPLNTTVRNALTVAGAASGLINLAANLGSRAWKKLNMGYLDSDSVFNPFWAFLSAILAGFTFPYIGMRSVNGGSDDSDVNLSFATFGQNGRRARQVVTLASAIVAIVFAATDIQEVQDALGFNWQHRGTVNLAVGTWWLLSTIASLSVCHRMELCRSIKIEPFLKRDEMSPVGCVVPSIPNMVVEPALRGEPMFACCPTFTDAAGVFVVVALGVLLIWQGIQQINGQGGDTVIDIVRP